LEHGVRELGLLPGSQTVYLTGGDGIVFWDLATGHMLRKMIGSYPAVPSPDGQLMLTGSFYVATLLDADSGATLRELEGHADYVSFVAVSPSRRYLATAAMGGGIHIWGIPTEDSAAMPARRPSVHITTPCDDAMPARLSPGLDARVTIGDARPVNVRDAPGGLEIGELSEGRALVVVGGPECEGGLTWWQVDFSLDTGWVAEGADGQYFVAPYLDSFGGGASYCPETPASRMAIGDRGYVAYNNGQTLSLRAMPGGDLLTRLDEGAPLTVLGGPQCQGDFTWWQVETD
ncbi:MAG: hypothetical protein GY778_13375, partial [bacterium]|nr:hypothetical protein [bacterium]